MMRYQRVSPDCVPPLTNAKKPSSENGKSIPNGFNHKSASFDTTKGFRFRSPSRTQDHHNISTSPSHSDANNNQTQRQETSPSPSPVRAGSVDMLFQWGQRKRARVSRSEIRALADESSSSGQARQALNKVPRRMDANNTSSNNIKLSPATTMPPPPPPQPPISANTRGGSLKKEGSAFLPHRNLEKRPGAGNGSPSRNSGGSSRAVPRSTTTGKRSPPTPENINRKIPTNSRSSAAVKDEKPNGSSLDQAGGHMINRHDCAAPATQSELVSGLTNNTPSLAASAAEKNIAEVIEWPRIYIALSRKEKEDDFFAMKGSKLPQRPKKRAKNVDKALQYCFPGMWLSDLTKSRYEVREKKCVKKQKRRGLKGMESMDSDSE